MRTSVRRCDESPAESMTTFDTAAFTAHRLTAAKMSG
jgi:hypothetical protein